MTPTSDQRQRLYTKDKMLSHVFRSFRLPQSLVLGLLLYQVLTNAFPTSTTDHRVEILQSLAADDINRSQLQHLDTRKANVTTLINRDFASELLEGGWEVIYEYFDSLLPSSVTAPLFAKFYGDVMLHVLSVASNTQPCSSFSLTQGLLMLEFYEPSGEGIPWHIVYSFANNLLTMTNMGFTAMYHAVYLHDSTDAKLAVRLRFVTDLARGVSGITSSLSSSGSNN